MKVEGGREGKEKEGGTTPAIEERDVIRTDCSGPHL